MRKLTAAIALAAGLALQAVAPQAAAQANGHRAFGVVKSVDAQTNSASIRHDPIASLKWPAMTMRFTAKDKQVLENLKVGSEVAFVFEERGKDYVITSVEK